MRNQSRASFLTTIQHQVTYYTITSVVRKQSNRYIDGKEEIKLYMLPDNMISYAENLKDGKKKKELLLL